MEYKPKSFRALVGLMNKEKGIRITSTAQRKKFRNMGYFHGYKGYRFAGKGEKRLNIRNFNELQAVYDFDMALKTLFYPQVMFIETALKNRALEVLLSDAKSSSFDCIYSASLTAYREHQRTSKKYRQALQKRFKLRNKIYSILSNTESPNLILQHYFSKDETMPVWAIFELISLGEFGTILQCMNQHAREELSKALNIAPRFDVGGHMPRKLVFAIKDLRNSIAHDNPVFDTRFNDAEIGGQLKKYIERETNINRIEFNYIDDYVILICFVMKILGKTKTEMKSFVNNFEKIRESFLETVPFSIYSKIIPTDTAQRMRDLRKYISK